MIAIREIDTCTVLKIMVGHWTFPTKIDTCLNISSFGRTKCPNINTQWFKTWFVCKPTLGILDPNLAVKKVAAKTRKRLWWKMWNQKVLWHLGVIIIKTFNMINSIPAQALTTPFWFHTFFITAFFRSWPQPFLQLGWFWLGFHFFF